MTASRILGVTAPRVAALLLAIASVAWAAAPLRGAGWPAFALVVAVACVAAGALRLALLEVPEQEEDYFLSLPERAWLAFLALLRLMSWEEIGCVAVLWLEVLHPARPWHTATLGLVLVAYLLAVHVAESAMPAGALLRRQARILIFGACLLALGAGAATLPATSGAGSAGLHVLAAIAVVAAAILVLPAR
jgi:hypothetical protein